MITISKIKRNDLKDNKSYILCELIGLSTDEKPIQIDTDIIENGSVFIEIDTHDVYLYDETSEEWLNPDIDTNENSEEVEENEVSNENSEEVEEVEENEGE